MPLRTLLPVLAPLILPFFLTGDPSAARAKEAPIPPADQPAIVVPEGTPPTLDGTMAPGEWDDARREPFADGSTLLLKSSGGYLYLGIRADPPELIVGNVFLARGNEIAILHSSAALGTALYRQEGDHWMQTQGFVWRCRAIDSSEAAQAERRAFLEDEHWVAANARMGSPHELEFQIGMAEETLRLAVNFIRAESTGEKIPWPADLDDDCILSTPVGLPVQLRFSPERWAILRLRPPEG